MTEAIPPKPPRITGFDYVRPLGSGGFAHVYQYEQDMPRRVVAVKVLESPLGGPRDRSDFEAEADAMARLSSHPSIVSVYSAGVATDGRPYLAMEYCPDSMRARTRGRAAPLPVVLDAGVRLAGALETAHRAGVLHRDIKPSNVLITTTGRPALADFGISSLHGRASSEDKARAMSVPWAAPEVVSGAASGTIASEVWSLGATLYTFAAGRSPFESADRAQNTRAKMRNRIERAVYTPVPGARGYAPVDAVLARAMQRDPQQRFATMREFGEALQRVQRGFGLDATPLDLVDPGWVAPAVRRREPSGFAVSSVRASTRAERRAAQRVEDRDGLLEERPASPLRAGLIGAAVALGAIGVVLLGILVFGGFG
ncbi:serine/threonine protein kinase [Leucobacter weissii]|uniref:non-specific serine/threonine protein kinase n=1 Tax=Leucobacter weissii TaxID=1983706 RepID=A0A939ML31_9MICO|nr:serine/threonine protein kinase [Leucobacter weissii]